MSFVSRPLLVVFLFVGSVVGEPEEVTAQAHRAVWHPAPAAVHEGGFDERLLRGVYGVEAPAFRIAMRGADRSAYPVFIGAPAVAWGAWLVQGREGGADAYRLTATQVVTYGAVVGVKKVVRRPRPYAALPGIESRSPRYSPMGAEGDSFAFPSGHAAMSFAMVTSWSLSHPEWYVIGPGVAWASAVSLSRVWLGVHYPSDVLTGALLGAALAAGVHLVGPALTPGFLEEEEAATAAPMIQIRVRL